MTDTFFDPANVTDRESFLRFVAWLTADREVAERTESANPQQFKWGGANGWQNGTISQFLESAVAGAEAQDDWGQGSSPSWKDFAEFLYLGKIYE